MQREQGFSEMQYLIDSGLAWRLEGAVGRSAMDMLMSGQCMLPMKSYTDYYGNKIPSRKEVKEGTTGSFANAVRFFTQNEW